MIMNKLKKTVPKNSLLMVLCVLMGCVMIYVISLRINADNIGEEWGGRAGMLAGRAIGSIQGLTTGRSEGNEAGRQAGLSAADTEADISNRLSRVQNLEVLVASVKLNDFHSIGDEVDYAALYLIKGEVIFSVDLSRAEIEMRDGDLYISVPQPVGDLVIDQSQIEKVAEYQKYFFTGDAEAGFDAYLNSMIEIYEKSVDKLNSYDVLIESARDAARKQIEQLASSASISTDQVYVEFRDME